MDNLIVVDDMDPAGPGPLPSQETTRRALVIGDQWVMDALHELQREVDSIRAIKRDKRQPVVYLQTPTEVLRAFEAGVVTKAEARKIMGLKAIRQPVQLARARAARRAS